MEKDHKEKLINEFLSIREIKRDIMKREVKIRKILKLKYNITTGNLQKIKRDEDLKLKQQAKNKC